jgi:hypothetical protein
VSSDGPASKTTRRASAWRRAVLEAVGDRGEQIAVPPERTQVTRDGTNLEDALEGDAPR